MIIIANFIKATAIIFSYILTVYMWIVIVRALLSWVNPDPYNPIVQFLYKATEPALQKVRQLIPMRGMAIDFSPIILIFAIWFLQLFLVPSMLEIAKELSNTL